MAGGKAWTAEEHELLRRLAPTGIGTKGIAAHLGRSENAVRMQAFLAKIPVAKPSLRSPSKALALKILTDGMTVAELSPHLGLPRSSGWRIAAGLHRAGLVHICGYRKARTGVPAAIYKTGEGVDAKRPPRKRPGQASREYLARLKKDPEKYRERLRKASGPRKPRADVAASWVSRPQGGVQ